MSTLIANKIINPKNGVTLYKSPQAVVQVVTVRSDIITTTTTGGGFTEIGGGNLRLNITPKFADSRLIIRFSLFGEMNSHNTIWRIFRDGAQITTAGEEGYNNQAGNVAWSGYFTDFYDTNDFSVTSSPSTANKYPLLYSQISGSTNSRYYSVHFLGSDGSSRTWYQNRTGGSLGQNQYENGVSVGHVIEVSR